MYRWILYSLITIANFAFWWHLGYQKADANFPLYLYNEEGGGSGSGGVGLDSVDVPTITITNMHKKKKRKPSLSYNNNHHNYDNHYLEIVPTHAISSYKSTQIADLRVPEDSLLLNINSKRYPNIKCSGYVHAHVSQKWSDDSCFIVVSVDENDIKHTPPTLRYKGIINKDYIPNKGKHVKHGKQGNQGNQKRIIHESVQIPKSSQSISSSSSSSSSTSLTSYVTTGFVKQTPQLKDRLQLNIKMKNLLYSLNNIQKFIQEKLSAAGINNNPNNNNKNGNGKNDLVLMTVNEGEMDMLVNFKCSCKYHNIDTSNIVVFAASHSIVESIDLLGFIGIYHDDFSNVSTKASSSYLDNIFVDMMWYKSFSLWILLKMNYNVLFQDVDLVWFINPFPYFYNNNRNNIRNNNNNSSTDGFFSDDGQRGLRYAPFYANSGFYFLKSNQRTVYFSWLVLCAYDSIKSGKWHVAFCSVNEPHHSAYCLPTD
jgi:hypothetical protein